MAVPAKNTGPKPKIMILGGLGFTGMNLVKYSIDNKLASKIRIVDKMIPETAFLSERDMLYVNHPMVERIQCNLSNATQCARAFKDEHFEYIINLAAETAYGQDDAVYKQHIFDIAVNIGKNVEIHHPLKFIHISTAQIYEPDKKPATESSKIKPWTKQALFHKMAEDELKKMRIPLVILRPSCIYGPGDRLGLTPRLICGAVYKHLNEKMEFLWGPELKLNTVHVKDVCGAIWHSWNKANAGETYNLSDRGDTDQGKINEIINMVFHVEVGFVGTAMSTMARLNMKAICEEINEKHTAPWGTMCRTAEIKNTPLSPFIDQELLYNTPLSVDGSKIESTGFRYTAPVLNPVLVKEVVDSFIIQKIFPRPKEYPTPANQPKPKF